MMAAVFAILLLALILGWFGPRWMALACLAVCLGLSVGHFLYEVYSPDYGFRMPWLQTELGGRLRAALVGRNLA